MNSPTDHNSHSDSSSDNDVEDITIPTEQPGLAAAGPSAPSSASFFNTSAPKRRLPGGLMMGGLSARDPKTRRKDVRGPTGGGGYWDSHMGPGPSRGFKDDLVDTQIVEQLRQQFGDPFDESDLKNATN